MRSFEHSSAGSWPSHNALISTPTVSPLAATPHSPRKPRSRSALNQRSHPPSPARSRIFRNAYDQTAPPLDKLQLSSRSVANVELALRNGWADSTLMGYGQAVARFMRFCDDERLPANVRLPANDFLLCAFAASSAGRHAGSTARSNISALKAWHIAQGADWQGGSRLRYILNGVEALAPGCSRRPPRPPITTGMLQLLQTHLDLDNAFDAAVFACACIAFWCQCRLGELLPASAVCDRAHIPSRKDLRPSRNGRARVLHLPRTKVSKRGEDVALVTQLQRICPIASLDNHLRVNTLPSHSSLFSYSLHGRSTPLSRAKFLDRCNVIWGAAGIPRSTGHSFRIGGTTELLLSGVPPDIVKALGRWSSDAFHRYWRALEEIAPRYAQNSTREGATRNRRRAPSH